MGCRAGGVANGGIGKDSQNASEFFAEGMAKSLTGKSDSYTKALRKILK